MTRKKENLLMIISAALIVVIVLILGIDATTGKSLTGLLRFSKQSDSSRNVLADVNKAPDTAPQFTDLIPRLMDAYVDTDGVGDASPGGTLGGTPAVGGGSGAGTPGGTNGTPGTGSVAAVADWAKKMTAVTSINCDNSYNAMTTSFTSGGYTTSSYPASDCSNPGNRFWCADLVHEAHYLAGFTDFPRLSSVPAMRNWFLQGHAGYYHIDYNGEGGQVLTQAELQAIKPGCVLFYGKMSDPSNNRGDHVDVIDDVKIDANGNVFISSQSVNTVATAHTATVVGGIIHPYYINIVGIGCHQ